MRIEVEITKLRFFAIFGALLFIAGLIAVTAYNSGGTGGTSAAFGHSVDEMDWSKNIPGNLSLSKGTFLKVGPATYLTGTEIVSGSYPIPGNYSQYSINTYYTNAWKSNGRPGFALQLFDRSNEQGAFFIKTDSSGNPSGVVYINGSVVDLGSTKLCLNGDCRASWTTPKCRICVHVRNGGGKQCSSTGDYCSDYDGGWSSEIIDDTDERSGYCAYQYRIQCQ